MLKEEENSHEEEIAKSEEQIKLLKNIIIELENKV